jgi:hypothetical protein
MLKEPDPDAKVKQDVGLQDVGLQDVGLNDRSGLKVTVAQILKRAANRRPPGGVSARSAS